MNAREGHAGAAATKVYAAAIRAEILKSIKKQRDKRSIGLEILVGKRSA